MKTDMAEMLATSMVMVSVGMVVAMVMARMGDLMLMLWAATDQLGGCYPRLASHMTSLTLRSPT